MVDLLAPLTDDQQALVDVIAEVFLEHGRWPIWGHVERTLDQRYIDAFEVATSLPHIGAAGGVYDVIWNRSSYNAGETLGLTILGIHHSQHFARVSPPVEQAFFGVVNYLAGLRRHTPSSPFEESDVRVEAPQVLSVVEKAGSANLLSSDAVYSLLEHEPATWYGGRGQPPGGEWFWSLSRQLLRYEGVWDVPTYMARISEAVAVPRPEVRAIPSPLDLPTSLDYLDAIWRLVGGHPPLLRLYGAERTAKLALEAGTADEYQARVGALAELISGFTVPATTVKPLRGRDDDLTLAKLQAHLVEILPPASHARIAIEIEKLQRIIDLRHGGHHGEARSRAAAASTALGISPGDWSNAWSRVQAVAIEAFDGIREEVTPLTRTAEL